ncbi:MAG: MaoC family dehydratase N-terminal domain-containing protein [Saccharofermentans sp.]|nr:MaoC family dehydratase N-terminal domain-containing protein [Saccharofermentans sp.]
MYFEDLSVGMSMPLDPAVIDKDDMLAFANKYDNVPLHTDEEYARGTRFGKLIAPGVMSFMVVWAKYLEKDYFGEELIAGASTKIEWFKPTFAGDTLIGVVTVTKMVERNPYNGLVELTIDITNQDGELVMRDVTEAVIKRKR